MALNAADAWVMRDCAKSVDSRLSDFDAGIVRLEREIKGLPDIWQGDNASVMAERMRLKTDDIKGTVKRILELCRKIEKAAEVTEEADKAAKTIASSINEIEKPNWGVV